MLSITQRDHGDAPPDDRLILPFDQRCKSRLRVTLESGIEAALMLERGLILRDGDRLLAEDGRIVQVVAAPEPVATTWAEPSMLLRVAYHLGNRHVPLQIGPNWLRFERDHVLEDMVQGLGVPVCHEDAPFEPEAGAYAGAHPHSHEDGHDHHHHHHDHR
jgi:urease accessory protein